MVKDAELFVKLVTEMIEVNETTGVKCLCLENVCQGVPNAGPTTLVGGKLREYGEGTTT